MSKITAFLKYFKKREKEKKKNPVPLAGFSSIVRRFRLLINANKSYESGRNCGSVIVISLPIKIKVSSL